MSLVVRVFVGFVVAYLAAGLTTALFVHTPSELLSATASDETWSQLWLATLVAATQSGLFATIFALVAAAIGEWYRVREWTYYTLTGIVIALLGFTAEWLSEETGQGWSVVNSNYPLIAFLTTGFVGGWMYWAFAGRRAGAPAASLGQSAKT